MEMIQIKNAELKGQKLYIKGQAYQIDEEGVMRCPPTVASLLCSTPGWREHKRDLKSELQTAENAMLQAEHAFREAQERLQKADSKLRELRRLARVETRVSNGSVPLQAQPPQVPVKTAPPAVQPPVVPPQPPVMPPQPSAEDLQGPVSGTSLQQAVPSVEAEQSEASGEEEEEIELPDMSFKKEDMIAFARKHEIGIDESGTKAQILLEIEAAFTDPE